MPPYSYPSFEEIEAKEWASNTVETILTDITPVSFQSDFCDKPKKLNILINDIVFRKDREDNPLRRSFSFLEENLFSPNNNDEKEGQKNARRSQSTILPSTSYANSGNSRTAAVITQSAPTSPTNKLSSQPSFSSRIRDTWHMDRASNNIKNTTDIFDHKKSVQLSKFIMTELLTTEETYLNHLMTIKNFYMDPLQAAAQKKSSLVNQKDIEIIFAFIPQLIILSTSLVQRLHETIALHDENEHNDAYIGKVFCGLESFFDIYIAYTVNFAKSKKHLSKASSSIVYRQLVQDTMRKKTTNRMILSDYMIAPIQRITRYCLLLKDLQKYSSPCNPDHVYLEKTLKCLSALAFAMNSVQ
ncbi:Dbl homology domain-containing protein [Mucor mucedo]|uniref:Dbl homology domain-containing protein n=1 Tax=Mucor mucedo TaxID=29922 RepID=UPI00221F57DE|nr:Dbl homology domain-containing protein [Mucor mucedo]KAI7896665.1 Dbl homology domain-containing protein [Mucor mucedo]